MGSTAGPRQHHSGPLATQWWQALCTVLTRFRAYSNGSRKPFRPLRHPRGSLPRFRAKEDRMPTSEHPAGVVDPRGPRVCPGGGRGQGAEVLELLVRALRQGGVDSVTGAPARLLEFHRLPALRCSSGCGTSATRRCLTGGMSFSLVDITITCGEFWSASEIAIVLRLVFESAPHNIASGAALIPVGWGCDWTLDPWIRNAVVGALPASVVALVRVWRA